MMPALNKAWDTPFDVLRDIDRAFNGRFNFANDELTTAKYPVDIHEDADGLTVTAELPGFKKEEVDLSIDNGVLTISAERKAEEPKEGTSHLHERRYTRVRRQFSLPSTVDANNVDASLTDGVLTLRLTKRDEVKPRKIEVK